MRSSSFLKQTLVRIPLLYALLLAACGFFSSVPVFAQTTKDMQDPDYPVEWAAIDSLEKEGLLRSAFDAVTALHARAVADQKDAQIVKTLIFQAKFQVLVEENGMEKAISFLQQAAENAPSPRRAILQSMLAELYHRYLSDNSWEIRQRTPLAEAPGPDIKTWPAAFFETEIARLYLASLDHPGLEQTPLTAYEPILESFQNSTVRWTNLYDILAFRALGYFSNSQSFLNQPVYRFYLEQPEAFLDAEAFAAYPFQSADPESAAYRALLLFQKLLRRGNPLSAPDAWVDLDLRRLSFVYDKSVLPDKAQHYTNALQRIEQRFPRVPGIAEAMYARAALLIQQGERYDPAQGEMYRLKKVEAKLLMEEAIQRFPGSVGAAFCAQKIQSLLSTEVRIETESVLIPGQKALISVAFKNVSRLYFRVVPLTWDKLESFGDRYGIQDEQLTDKPLRSWEATLPDDGDLQQHRTELIMESLPHGRYALLVSTAANFKVAKEMVLDAHFFTVSELAGLVENNSNGDYRIMVTHRVSGTPLQGVDVQLTPQDYSSRRERSQRQIEHVKTNAEGIARFSLDDNSSFYSVVLVNGKDSLSLGNNYNSGRRHDFNRTQIWEETVFFLDRAIYRPGQLLFFKGLCLRRKGELSSPEILANQSVQVILRNANYEEVAKASFTTNAYGTFSGTFTIPLDGLTGQLRLESSIGSSSQSFRVEEYKRPRFETALLPLEGAARLGQTVVVKGEAKNFAGNPVDGATVNYRVVRTVRYPWRWWWRGTGASSAAQEITRGQTTTDAQGGFLISFNAAPDLSVSADDLPEYQFEVHADVVDITGETHSAQRSVMVGYRALHLTSKLPEEIDRQVTSKVVVQATNLDGQAVDVPGTVQLFRLAAPANWFTQRYWELPDRQTIPEAVFKKEFPWFAFGKEDDPATWEKGAAVWNTSFHTGQSDTVPVPFASFSTGYYLLVLQATDADGQAVEKQYFFQLFDAAAKIGPQPKPVWVAWNQPVAEPGQTASLQLFNDKNQTPVFVELCRGQEILKALWVKPNGWTTLDWVVSEADRGNMYASVTYVHQNRDFSEAFTLQVPWTNKDLQISYETFRDKLLPGQQEEWRMRISGPLAEKVSAEMLAAMYDASLDQFVPHSWRLNLFHSYSSPNIRWNARLFGSISSSLYLSKGKYIDAEKIYPSFRWFDFPSWATLFDASPEAYEQVSVRLRSSMGEPKVFPAPMALAESPADPVKKSMMDSMDSSPIEAPTPEAPVLQTRTNLNETVFFFPQLKTNAEGEVIFSFKMNEALTRWKFMALAHTKDLQSAYSVREVVTQKDLMVFPNAPRFMRERDELVFAAKVSNLSGKPLSGKARLELFDAVTMQSVDSLFGNNQPLLTFEVAAGLSVSVAWPIRVPVGKVGALTYRVSAVAGNVGDAEENTLPVLTNRMLVTETLPLYVRGKSEKSFTMESMKASRESETLTPFRLSLDFTPNPAWLAVKALPYLMEYPYECSEQLFSRYFANSLAAQVLEKNPRIKAVFDRWKGTDALDGQLSKNQELKAALLQETPWVLESQAEETQRRNIALLFDLNRMGYEQGRALDKLANNQLESGGFPWFAGGPESWYITQYIVSGLGKLRYLGVNHPAVAHEIWENGLRFIDQQLLQEYYRLLKEVEEGKTTLDKDHLGSLSAHYLYARSFAKDVTWSSDVDTAMAYYISQAIQYWNQRGSMEQAMLALALHRFGKTEAALRILASLRERALHSDEMGMYWKAPRGFYWYQRPTESQAMLIEAFDEIGKNAAEIDELKLWLLNQKRTSDWETTTATAEAIYALFRTGAGANWLASDQPVSIQFDNARHKKQIAEKIGQAVQQAEAGTGSFKVSWQESEIERGMHTITLKNPNPSVAWGGLYWQYFEDLDKITTFEETPLTLKKTLYREENSDRGPVLYPLDEKTPLHPGDKVVVRLELRVDRDMEYVHLKDMRASALEPIHVLSGYRWQGGLGYYESPGDLATNFFIDYIGKGTYVFEYPLRVTQKGAFSNGISSIQCMYAPEFSSHSQGIRIEVR